MVGEMSLTMAAALFKPRSAILPTNGSRRYSSSVIRLSSKQASHRRVNIFVARWVNAFPSPSLGSYNRCFARVPTFKGLC